MAEESVTHLKAALKEARRATIARAVALADALGVKPPGTILSRPEKDEYIDRFSIKDAETIEGDARLPSPSADQGSYHVTTLESSGKVTPQHQNALRLRELMRERTESPVSTSAGLGWNREWSRTVDIWCREECDLFQERVAVEITKAAHRLHWLGGRTNGKNQASKEKCHICRRRCDGKGCASLGDIADILELVRCTFDLVVLVEGISPPPDILASKASTYQQEMTPPTVEDRGCISRRPVTAGIGHAKRLLEPEPAPWFEGTPLGDARVGLRKERGGDHNAPWSSKCLPSIDEDSIVDTGSEGEGGAEGRGFETMPSRNLHEDPALERYDAKGYDAKDLPEEEGCPELERRFARLVLDPATIARTLGIKPLSAFALRAARQKASCSLPPRGPFNTATTDMATGILRRVTKQGATNEGQLIHGGDDVEARSFTPGTLELPTEQLFPHLPFSTRVFIEEELLSGREKHQIACAFESFLLPQLRISWYKSGYGDRILPHLSLELAEVGGKAAEASDDAEGQEVEASSPANPLALATGKESPRGEISSGTPLVDESG